MTLTHAQGVDPLNYSATTENIRANADAQQEQELSPSHSTG